MTPEANKVTISDVWLMHVDGSAGSQKGGAGILLQGPNLLELEYAVKLDFEVANNEAEYEALIIGLNIAKKLKVERLSVYTDSQLVAMQIEGSYETREVMMINYLRKVKDLMNNFKTCEVHQVPREENERADALSKFGAMMYGVRSRKVTLLVAEKSELAQDLEVNVLCVQPAESWKDPYIRYLA